MKVTLVGASGGIGQSLALLLHLQLPPKTELCLYDRSPLNIGVGLDLSHIPNNVTITAFDADNYAQALTGSDIIIIVAGVPRKPGMTRADLLNINSSIVYDLTNKIAKYAPDSFIVIVTNPVNSTVPVAAKALQANNLNCKRLFGVTTLDVIRARAFVGRIKNVSPKQVELDVIGGHSAETMLPVLSDIKNIMLTAEEKIFLTEKIKNAGTEVVNAKNGNGSATLSMANAGAIFVASLVKAIQGLNVIENAYCYIPEKNTFLACPIIIDKDGIKEYLSLPVLDAYERQEYAKCLVQLEQDIAVGLSYEPPVAQEHE